MHNFFFLLKRESTSERLISLFTCWAFFLFDSPPPFKCKCIIPREEHLSELCCSNAKTYYSGICSHFLNQRLDNKDTNSIYMKECTLTLILYGRPHCPWQTDLHQYTTTKELTYVLLWAIKGNSSSMWIHLTQFQDEVTQDVNWADPWRFLPHTSHNRASH